MSEYLRNRYEYLKKEHRCVRCAGQDERTLSGKIYCTNCNKYNTSNVSKWRERKRSGIPTYLATSFTNLRDYCYEQPSCTNCELNDICAKGISVKDLTLNYDLYVKEKKNV